MRILVVTRGYPSADWLYNYPFVHRRVLDYEARGHAVRVFVLLRKRAAAIRNWDGVSVFEGGDDALLQIAGDFRPDCVAAHSIADDFWPSLEQLPRDLPIFGWIHGAELMAYYRTAQRVEDVERMERARQTFTRRMGFWKALAGDWPRNLHLVFASRNSADEAFRNLGRPLPSGAWDVVPQPIDTSLFGYRTKAPEDRFKILSIRPFHDWRYANDLTSETIRILSSHPVFERLSFHVVGDGRLFDENLSPIRSFGNVTVERRFLPQEEIAELHGRYGIFLVPTRDDVQGVSRDEAMSSGLVPVTNSVAAIPEFVDSDCGGLAERDDAAGLAREILAMVEDPALFQSRSSAAATRVRARLASSRIIPQELSMMAAAIARS